MKYLLFLNHPKGEKVFKLSKTKEKNLRKYFKTIDTLETIIDIRGKKYPAKIDFNLFHKLTNFDCFNCQDHCCGDNPIIYEKITRDFLIKNFKEYNRLTHNGDILEEFGFDKKEIKTSMKNDIAMAPEDFVEEEISHCTCSFKLNNSSTLCSIHAIALQNNLSFREIVKLKPLVCSLWPLEIIIEDDESMAYVTLPDDFTNSFISEDYYKISCINLDYAQSPTFRRFNPEGFLEKDFTPLYETYKDTLIFGLGEKFFIDLMNKISEEI